MVLVVFAGALTLAASVARADVFNMPAGETSLLFVPVGDPGNAADSTVMNDGTTGYGSVPYDYKMGEYDVTVGQYCQFLNAVAKTDTYGLYSGVMLGLYYPTIGIAQSGSSGDYSYSVTGGYSQGANCPIFGASWGDAARFCNWLQNKQPTYPAGTPGEVTGSTETGAYTLDGDTTNLMTESRNAGATYFIPSENEWYKAAYYKGRGANAGYWSYPTQSDSAPSNVLSTTGTNNANYQIGRTGSDPTNNLTPVGAFSASPGPYGTFDMAGDVWQWNEANISGEYRGLRGGAWDYGSDFLASFVRYSYNPTDENFNVGFRVASSDPGDVNGDGKVDINDLTVVLANYGKTGCTWPQGCMDGDPAGTVDINDLTIVLANYGATAGSGLAAVPEPSALVLIGLGAIGLLAFAWRWQSSLCQGVRLTSSPSSSNGSR
jgi:formylglycine-generating enzyme required for sulfatase activity